MKHQDPHRHPQRLAAAGVLLSLTSGVVLAQQTPRIRDMAAVENKP